MQRVATVRSGGFVVMAGALVVAGVAVVALPIATQRLAYAYAPFLLSLTTLSVSATAIVLALILERTHRRAIVPLAIGYGASGVALAAVVIVLPLTGAAGATLYGRAAATPLLFAFLHLTVAAGAFWYARERWSDASLTPPQTRLARTIAVPVALVLAGMAATAILLLSPVVPHPATGENADVVWATRVALLVACVEVATLVSLARLLRTRFEALDAYVTVGSLAQAVGTAVLLIAGSRPGLTWSVARLFFLIGSTTVLVGAARRLKEIVAERTRLKTDALLAEANAFEQNAAVEASLVKSQFVAMVSHELRTPLGGIIGMAELLDRTQLTAQQRYFAGAIRNSADALLRIVNDLLDFSRAESGKLDLEDVPFDLAATIEDVVTPFRVQAHERDVGLHVFVDPSLPAIVRGDPTRLRQVLQNLLNNAVRFTERGSIRIEVSAELPAGMRPMMRFAVHDSGIGIAPGAQERVFAAFTQEDASTSRRFGGTGLGLAIAKHLVELMGGRIMLRSIVGVGSTFTFTFPLRTEGHADVAMPLRDLRVLVVEPDPTIRELLHRYVTAWEMRATTVAAWPDLTDDEPREVVIVGPGLHADEASALVASARVRPALANADAIYIRGDHCADGECPDGFRAAVGGPLRQSTLFDTIVRLRRDGVIAAAPATPERIMPRRPRRERILIAEDNEVNQSLLVAQLEYLGFSSDVVDDGSAAIRAATERRYDLIFMDCQMPGVDGFEASRRIRSIPGHEAVPIIAVTANVLPGYREICVAAGMNDYLAKPALIDPLARIVDRWLPPVARTAPAARPAPSPPCTDALRDRLRTIFRGDEERVRATIDLAATSLREAIAAIDGRIAEADADGAKRLAHKLRGIALEIGFVAITERARALETAVASADWPSAGAILTELAGAVERETSLPEESPR